MTPAHRATEIAGVAAVAALTAALGASVWRAAGAADLPWIAAATLAAWLAADAISGLVHWWADRIGSESTPWLGPNFVRAFREHHEDPAGITRHDFIDTNGNTCIAIALPLATLWWWAPPAESGAAALGLRAFAVALALWVALTNQIHQWAHRPDPGRIAAWLQRRRLVLPAEHHAVHHAAPYDRRYCITHGWLNAPLDAVGLFSALEAALRRAAGRPRGVA